ncbi:MAG TPA: heme biosynthesis HemY N-terminal domain-containing protein [Methylocystis sp.]|nr:heme biosynthesis HemY N-terminal domain-containing protein [Methylocystis sp.]
MWFVLLFLVALALIAYGLEWIVDQPGSLSLVWGDIHIERTIAEAVGSVIVAVIVVLVAWKILTIILGAPWRFTASRAQRSREKGFRAITRGIAAVAAGDAALALRSAQEAQKHVPAEPLTKYLRAQAAQLAGDTARAEALFHEMTLHEDTKLLGLRGLHIEAKRRDDAEAAHHFAATAHEIAPLPWAGAAILERHTSLGDWEKARAAIEENYKAKTTDLATTQRLRAVIETALAMEKQAESPQEAMHLANMALKRRPSFTPAALVAATTMTRLGHDKKAIKFIESVWAKAPHPELGAAYVAALKPQSNSDALQGVLRLFKIAPGAVESRHLVAQVALAARNFAKAREALAPLVAREATPTAHTCLLMAEIEDAENGPSGPVREWLARGSRAPRDPVWIADGVVSRSWAPISPKTGRLDAFEWAPPPDAPSGVTTDARANIPAAFLAPEPTMEIAAPSPAAPQAS